MNILFGIQGTGNGHISRARILAAELAKHNNINVQYLFSGRPKSQLFDMEIFGDYWHRRGLTFITNNGKVDNLKTALHNNIFQFGYDIATLNLSKFDLVITDFEPIVAWAGKLKNKRVLGIGHQYAFGQNTPVTGDTLLTRAIMKNFAPASMGLGLHWHNYDTNVFPPIIDTKLTPKISQPCILVYLPFENQHKITNLLLQFPETTFIQYAPNLVDKTVNNVLHRKTSLAFKKDLTKSTGVICNSGFELISECLHLGIPILTKPLNGQMEQHSNALALQQLNYATTVNSLNLSTIEHWLKNKQVPQPKPIPNVAKAIAKLIVEDNLPAYQGANNALWQAFN